MNETKYEILLKTKRKIFLTNKRRERNTALKLVFCCKMKRKKLKELTDTINFSRRVFDMDYFPDKPFSFFFLYVFTIKIYKSMKRTIYAANEDIQDKHFPIEKKREEKKNKISCNGRRIGPRG